MTNEDKEAAEFYEYPQNRAASGPPVRRKEQHQRLTNHVPVRFSAATINQVKALADEDGVTVSSWIRGVVEREIRRRVHTIRTGLSDPPHFELLSGITPAGSTSVPNEEPASDIQSAMA